MQVDGKLLKSWGRFVRIARLDADTYQFLADPGQFIGKLKTSGLPVDIFTFTQRVDHHTPMFSYAWEWDNQAVLPVTTYGHWSANQIDGRVRAKIRKAEKSGVQLRVVPFGDELVRGIWEIYNETPVRQGRPFHNFGKPLSEIRRDLSTFLDSSIFIGAFHNEKMIGFVKLVADETWTQVNIMHIISMVRHSDKSPTNALISESVRACADRGASFLVYGRFVYPNKPPDGITVFKRHNGFQQINLPRYYVSITRLGSAALALGLHHRLADRLPEALVNSVRGVRSQWYGRKLDNSTKMT